MNFFNEKIVAVIKKEFGADEVNIMNNAFNENKQFYVYVYNVGVYEDYKVNYSSVVVTLSKVPNENYWVADVAPFYPASMNAYLLIKISELGDKISNSINSLINN